MLNISQGVPKCLCGVAFILALLFNVGCTVKPDDLSANTSIDEIINLAERAKKRKAFKEAGDFYMEIDRLFPYSDKSRIALVEAMKVYHDGADLINVRLSAKRYLMLYPYGPDAAFSQYMVALSFFDAIVDVQRDQGAALHAVREFKQLDSDYAASDYSALAKKKMKIAYSQLAGQEMAVGRYYMKREEYLAGINRFLIVVNDYPDTIFLVEAFYRLTEAYVALGMTKLARENNALLQKQFPNSEWNNKSNKVLSRLNL